VNGQQRRGKGKERRGELLLPVTMMVTTPASLAPASSSGTGGLQRFGVAQGSGREVVWRRSELGVGFYRLARVYGGHGVGGDHVEAEPG
jgi:hypothetical protein